MALPQGSKETMPRVTPHCAIKNHPQERKTELLNQSWGLRAGGDWGAHRWRKDGLCQGHCASQSLWFWKGWRKQSPEPQTASEKKSHHSTGAFPLGVDKRLKERGLRTHPLLRFVKPTSPGGVRRWARHSGKPQGVLLSMYGVRGRGWQP